MPPSILNLFLTGDDVEELAPALSRVGLVLQYRQDRPTSPLNFWNYLADKYYSIVVLLVYLCTSV